MTATRFVYRNRTYRFDFLFTDIVYLGTRFSSDIPWQLLGLGNLPDNLPGAVPGVGTLSPRGVRADAYLDRPPRHGAAGVPLRHLYHRRRPRHHVREGMFETCNKSVAVEITPDPQTLICGASSVSKCLGNSYRRPYLQYCESDSIRFVNGTRTISVATPCLLPFFV